MNLVRSLKKLHSSTNPQPLKDQTTDQQPLILKGLSLHLLANNIEHQSTEPPPTDQQPQTFLTNRPQKSENPSHFVISYQLGKVLGLMPQKTRTMNLMYHYTMRNDMILQ